ncbi:putative oxidoreductase [Mariniradius saccharolyticus AK6]|uniref:Oxidoreductase n=1 Tax=Mariniradius saccharolyticus AK6 TaxID=1239962 RepID=M7XF56_9BACT|nr:putative oxidoreductase C-terminal domain-containing protein [Mariniradius saccharolyticus]EMS33183.1 putative oxidoreductase [Mariniradius saccharolyticus AK6]
MRCIIAFSLLLIIGCVQPKEETMADKRKITFMSLNPGHFHAALIHKSMYPHVDSTVYVFAPAGDELKDYLGRIDSYNSQPQNPTAWKIEAYVGTDFLYKMISQKPGNVMVVAGKNDQKIDYIMAAIQNGIHVYADKPLVINREGYGKLREAFVLAAQKDLLLYDIMTERFEIASMLQRELSMNPEVFGELVEGTLEEPAITKESVHHFYKQVSGKPLVRPDWFFDVRKQGEGLVDVTTHLVDLIQWAAFPEQTLDTADVQMLSAKRWPTPLSIEQFQQVTGKTAFPEYLKNDLQGDTLQVFGNGELHYTLRGKHAKVSVTWDFQAPEGGGDTHFSIMRGSKAELIIRQGPEQAFKPTLYIRLLEGQEKALKDAIRIALQTRYPGLDLEKQSNGEHQILIPDEYHVGHEAHFAQVTEKFLEYFLEGKMPAWEVPNMLVKYHTTTRALELAGNYP